MLRTLVALLVILWSSTALGHQLGRSYCTVRTVPGGVDVTVETTAAHLVPSLGLSSRTPSAEELRMARPRLFQQLEDRVQARTPGGACQVEPGSYQIVSREGEPAVAAELHFACPAGPVTLRNSWRLDVDPASESVCAIDGAAWVFRIGAEERAIGTPPRMTSVLGSFVKLGMLHVFSGVDHVLFVIALLVAAALVCRQRSVARGYRTMAGIVTGFTLGHSVTLIAAGLGWVRMDPRITESIIALSIVVVGIENLVRRDARFRTLTAALFGLVHGFGFATVLAETELPRRGAVWALLSFNVGIELAQLCIVTVVFPLLALAARRKWYERAVLVPISAAVAIVAAIWFVKRATGASFLPWLGS